LILGQCLKIIFILQIDDKKRSSAQELLYNDFIIKDTKEFSNESK